MDPCGKQCTPGQAPLLSVHHARQHRPDDSHANAQRSDRAKSEIETLVRQSDELDQAPGLLRQTEGGSSFDEIPRDLRMRQGSTSSPPSPPIVPLLAPSLALPLLLRLRHQTE